MRTERERFQKLVDATEIVPFAQIEMAAGGIPRRAPRTLPAEGMVIATMLVVAVAALLMVRFEDRQQTAAPPTSLEDLYRRVGIQIDRPGHVLQQTARTEMDAGQFSHSATQEQWIDPRGNAVRMEWTYSPKVGGESHKELIITTGEVRVSRNPDGTLTDVDPKQFACYGASVSVSAVLGCPLPTEDTNTRIEKGTYEGRPLLVLIKTGTLSSSDTNEEFTERMYLDPQSLLPMASEREGTLDYGERVPLRARTTYEHQFVEEGSLPEDFFKPSSIGHDPRAGLEELERVSEGMEVYWLGERLEGRGELPPLAFGSVENEYGKSGPGYEFILVYGPTEDRHSPVGVGLEEWRAGDWERARVSGPWDSPCSSKRDIELRGGRAVIYGYYQDEMVAGTPVPAGAVEEPGSTIQPAPDCPGEPANQFLAHVYLGETFIQIHTYSDDEQPNPYNSVEGMEYIVRSLRPQD